MFNFVKNLFSETYDYAVLKFSYDRWIDENLRVEIFEMKYSKKEKGYKQKFIFAGNINQAWNCLIEKNYYPIPGTQGIWVKDPKLA